MFALIILLLFTSKFNTAAKGHPNYGYTYPVPDRPLRIPEGDKAGPRICEVADNSNVKRHASRYRRNPQQSQSNYGYAYPVPDIPFEYPDTDINKTVICDENDRSCSLPPSLTGVPPSPAGGGPALDDEFPYMAAIGWKLPNCDYDYACGGTLIAADFVLTAAHCRSRMGQRPDVVRIGGGKLNSTLSFHQPIEISNVYVHPQYRRKLIYNDIAILKLKSPSEFKGAFLWTSNAINYTRVTAIGYGRTGPDLGGSNFLIKVDVNLISNEVCSPYYPPGFRRYPDGLRSTQLCAGDFNRVRDTCPGDSGGPILVRIKNGDEVIAYIVGVTSYGPECARGIPAIYTRVSSYIDWIESIVGQRLVG